MTFNLDELTADEAIRENLIACNVNLQTGFATNYLNHFIEVLLLFELLPDMPECIDDIRAWEPMSYSDHVEITHLKDSDLILRAYEAASDQNRSTLQSVAQKADELIEELRSRVNRCVEACDTDGIIALSEEASERGEEMIASLNRVVHFGLDQTDPAIVTQ